MAKSRSSKRKRPAKPGKRSVAASAAAPAPAAGAGHGDVVLDTSGDGGPFIPQAAGAGGVLGAAPGGVSTAPNEDLVVELELASGAAPLGAALVANTAGFIAGSLDGAESTSDVGLRGIFRQYGLKDAKPVFTRDQVRDDEVRTQALRQAAAVGAASPEQVSALERLPSLANFLRLRFPPGTPASEVTAALKQLPEVARAVVVPRAMPPMLASADPVPGDPLIGSASKPLAADPVTGLEHQWYLHRTRVPQAWRYARGANVVVADIDWGFRTSHEDLQAGIERTYNAFDGSTGVTTGPNASHGTAVLGIAGARSNGMGIAGYAPGATLWAIQGDSGSSPKKFAEPWAEAIDFVRRTDANGRRKVIILEVQTGLGGNYEQVPSVHRAIRAAIADGCVVCVAAGNGNRPADRTDSDDLFDPTGSILVGATAFDRTVNKRASFSNFGSRIVVSAPGDPGHDLTCGHAANNAYRNGFGGTSGATPKVAGTVALMLSVNPELTHTDARDILSGTGLRLEEDPGRPIGVLLNAEAAVAEALRRRSEALPSETLGIPGWSVMEPPATKSVHGVRRRTSQLVLPRDLGGPISWDLESDAAALETSAASPSNVQPPPGDKSLREFRETVEGSLTQQDRILIVGQAIQMLDSFYVHRPLKEAIHAVRPIQRLRVLQRRLQQQSDIPAAERDELAFHNTLTQIFNSVRDLHTNYQLPRPYRDFIAYLPFEVASFYEGGTRRYIVTRVVPGHTFADASFQPGVELIYWNGTAIERAVRANAEQTAGSNDAARHARGVSSLTIRPMNTALPPDADFVDLEFVPVGAVASDPSARRQMRQHWFVRYAPRVGSVSGAAPGQVSSSGAPGAAPAEDLTFAAQASLDLARQSTAQSSDILFAAPPSMPAMPRASAGPSTSGIGPDLAVAACLGLDTAADAVREARQLIFDSQSLRGLQRAGIGDEVSGIRGSASPGSVADTSLSTEISVKVQWSAAFRARTVQIGGVPYGHIHIRTFYVENVDDFIEEFLRLLQQIPENGLILDVRGNGGGNIWASERLLQTLTAVEIEPERMQFVVTPGTLDLCRNNMGGAIPLGIWRPSLEEAVETGSLYSHAFPLTDKESCNVIGQRYYGPVVLVVDGNSYSATDIFAAGFQDHKIGMVLGVSASTGAGGANVWEHWLLNKALPIGWGLKPLPGEAGMRVAIRQSLRVGPRAGSLLEDFGVVPDDVHQPTRADVMSGDVDLLAYAAKHLTTQPRSSIKLAMGGPHARDAGKRQVTINTSGLTRLDFFVDDRPQGSTDLDVDATGTATLAPAIRIGAKLLIVGYAQKGGRPAAAIRARVP